MISITTTSKKGAFTVEVDSGSKGIVATRGEQILALATLTALKGEKDV